jgi:prepilin-type N-terminal cleavage/methylation domain-containing protein
MAAINTKVKGSTLIEVLVAMVIILICFSVGMAALMQLNHKQNSTIEIKASFALQNYINKTLEYKTYTNEEINQNEFSIKRTASVVDKNNKIINLQFEVYAPGMECVILKKNKIVVNEK